MSLSLHTLKPSKGSKHTTKRLGRGNASGKGSYSTKGIKGQRARQGGRKGLVQFGVKHFVARLPKVRGFQSFKPITQVVSLNDLAVFKNGATVTVNALKQRGLITSTTLPVKLIGVGKLKVSLQVDLPRLSSGARAAIIKAGGSIKA
ncbi:MAG: 50S ribosomal protein L15 [Candidatus Kerfeldbacteria bacterium]|nr:50S ribosomal protein L15 [Candidatus Kerfeldbacteria bacterium]